MKYIALSVFLSVCLSLFLAQQIFTQSVSMPSLAIETLQDSVNTTIERISPSVVSVIVEQEFEVFRTDPFGFFYTNDVITKQVGGGTGVVVSEDGFILTNKHVVQNAQANYIVVTHDGIQLPVQNIYMDPITDIALLEVKTGDISLTPALFIQNQHNIHIGDFVIAIGNALGEFSNSSTFGIISGKNRSIQVGTQTEVEYMHGLLQTDAAINRGNSGGPLVNIRGEVIGINTATVSTGTGVGFAIPYTSQTITSNIQSIQQWGSIARAYLGIFSINLTPGIAQREWLIQTAGAYIPTIPEAIISGSPAESAWLLPGDIITHIDSVEISGDHQLQSILASKLPNDTITLSILRGSQTITLDITLGSRS